MPAAHLYLRGIVTNTTPMAAYRGIGRLEANYILERLIDQVAHELGLDAVEIRRMNLLRAEDLPWETPGGALITSGEFLANLDTALAAAGAAFSVSPLAQGQILSIPRPLVPLAPAFNPASPS